MLVTTAHGEIWVLLPNFQLVGRPDRETCGVSTDTSSSKENFVSCKKCLKFLTMILAIGIKGTANS